MQEHEMRSLLEELGLDKIKRTSSRKGTNLMFCCPFHGERHPSAGILVEDEYGSCYSCGEGFTLAKLVAHCKDMRIHEAINWLQERYGAHKREFEKAYRLRLWEEISEENHTRFELSRLKIAPFRSGKETHSYFFKRGFNEETAQKFLIGWDKQKQRVTVPIFHPDGVLAGIIGRAVLEPKLGNGSDNVAYKRVYGSSPKYFIYENFPISQVLFPSNQFVPHDETAILVEGTFDAMWMHQLGFTNTLATIIARLPLDGDICYQSIILHYLGVKKVILFQDNDFAGELGRRTAYDALKDEFKIYSAKYPENVKDPMGLKRGIIVDILEDAVPYTFQELRRYE